MELLLQFLINKDTIDILMTQTIDKWNVEIEIFAFVANLY